MIDHSLHAPARRRVPVPGPRDRVPGVDTDRVIGLLTAEVEALLLTVAGLSGGLPEDPSEPLTPDSVLALRDPGERGLGALAGQFLAGSLEWAVRGVAGTYVQPGPGTAGSVLLAWEYARELPDRVVIDAAVAAERLMNTAAYWQGMLTAILADRRESEVCASIALLSEQERPLPLEEEDARDLARRSAIAEVAGVSGSSEYRLRSNVALLRELLPEHPVVVQAVRSGRIDLGRARVIVEVTGLVCDLRVRRLLDGHAVEAAAAGAQSRALRRLMEQLVAQFAPADHAWLTERHHAMHTGVKVRPAGYGLASLRITADASLIEQVDAAIETLTRLATTPPDEGSAGTNGASGHANPAQVVSELIINAAETGHGFTGTGFRPVGRDGRVRINLTVPLSTLLEHDVGDAPAVTAADVSLAHDRGPDSPDTDAGVSGPVERPTLRHLGETPQDDPAEGWSAVPPPTRSACPASSADAGRPIRRRRSGGRSDAPGDLGRYGVIPAALAREIIAEHGARGTWRCQYLDDRPGSPHYGSIIGVGRAAHDPTYAPSRTTRDYVLARDRTCRFPGCERSASACDLDHVTPHAQGGPTCGDNLIALCRHHHRLKHRGGFTPSRDGADLLWTTPTGHLLRVTPRHVHAERLRLDAERPPPF